MEYDFKGNVRASCTSFSDERKVNTSIVLKHDRFYLNSNSFADDIPVVIAFKAMGIESDQEIVQLIGSETKYAEVGFPPCGPPPHTPNLALGYDRR